MNKTQIGSMIMKHVFIPILIAANGIKTGHLVKMMESQSREIYLIYCLGFVT